MRPAIPLVCILFGCSLTSNYDTDEVFDVAAYARTLTRADIENRLTTYLVKDPGLRQQIVVSDSAIELLDPAGVSRLSLELALSGASVAAPASRLEQYFSSARGTGPLSGLRVALDPGHFGGPLARTERRYIDMGPLPETQGQRLQFDEGTLTLQTALALREMLESAGAEVLLTRDRVGFGAYPKFFDDWYRDDLAAAIEARVAEVPGLDTPEQRAKWMNPADKSAAFRDLYNRLDLDARSQAINRFDPHFTLFIHYNAGSTNAENGQNIPGTQNYNMVFVGGSFAAGELASNADLEHFMRLLVSKDHVESVALSQTVLKHVDAVLGVPAVTDTTPVPTDYLNRFSMKVSEGVYCRNLALTRIVRGAMAYGETLCQDHPAEALALATNDITIAGQPASSRVLQTAQGYFAAIQELYGR